MSFKILYPHGLGAAPVTRLLLNSVAKNTADFFSLYLLEEEIMDKKRNWPLNE